MTPSPTRYIVHIYREMRLTFPDIEAPSPEAAACLAADKPTHDADTIDDCEGDTLTALVDIEGDTEYVQSQFIDFEPAQLQKSAPRLRAALQEVLLALRHYGDWEPGMPGHLIAVIEAAINNQP
jgi:hypothetical protein